MRNDLRDYNRFHQRNSRDRARVRRLIGTTARAADCCWTCGEQDCARAACRAIRQFSRQRGFRRDPRIFGELFPLWATIAYLQAMATGVGGVASEFGKRFAHRKSGDQAA
jgi:hypothetical protein